MDKGAKTEQLRLKINIAFSNLHTNIRKAVENRNKDVPLGQAGRKLHRFIRAVRKQERTIHFWPQLNTDK